MDVEAILSELRRALASTPGRHAGALVTVAAGIQDNRVAHVGRVRFMFEPGEPRASRIYTRLLLLEDWLAAERAVTFVSELLAGRATIHGIALPEAPTHANWQRGFGEHGDPFHIGSAAWVLRASGAGGHFYDDRLISFGSAPRPSQRVAASEWLGREHSNPGDWHVIVPDNRGALVAPSWVDDDLEVPYDVAVPAQDVELHVLFHTRAGGTAEGRHMPLHGSPVRFSAPQRTDSAELFLVTRETEILAQARVSRTARPAEDAQREALEQRVRHDLAGGETVEVEYKEWISPGHFKQVEVVRTVVAFANTKGGRLYLGVRNDGSVQPRSNLEHAVAKYENAIADPVARVRHWIEALIRHKVAGTVSFEMQELEIQGEPVVRVDVEPSDHGVITTEDGDIRIRRNSSNMRPDANTELPVLLRRRTTMSGLARRFDEG